MIESSMYLGIGLLFGILIGLLLIPLAYTRAVRLTTRRVEALVPELTAEVLADKDLLRAEFAMSTRRLEIANDLLLEKIVKQAVELGKKDDVIHRLRDEARRSEVITPAGSVISPKLLCRPQQVVLGSSDEQSIGVPSAEGHGGEGKQPG
jgi:hypothetical protein